MNDGDLQKILKGNPV